MIEINDADQSKIREILDNNPGKCWRIEVEGDGCAGPYFGLSLDKAESYEKITRVNDIDFVMSDTVKRLSEITTIKIFINPAGKDLF
jgi:Fe-S cluster assembly iron-binding protein IscA